MPAHTRGSVWEQEEFNQGDPWASAEAPEWDRWLEKEVAKGAAPLVQCFIPVLLPVLFRECDPGWKGKEGEAKSTAASRSQRQPRPTIIISFYVSHEWKFLQLGEGWLMAVVNQCWECCMGFYSWGKWCRLDTTQTAPPNLLCFYLPLTIQGFCAFQNKCVIEAKLMCETWTTCL